MYSYHNGIVGDGKNYSFKIRKGIHYLKKKMTIRFVNVKTERRLQYCTVINKLFTSKD